MVACLDGDPVQPCLLLGFSGWEGGGGWEQTEARRKKRRGERVRAEPVLGGKGREGKARTSHTRLWQIQ